MCTEGIKPNVSKNPTSSKAKQAYFLSCVRRGAIDEVKNILKAGTIDVNDKDNSEGFTVTALHEAARAGNISIIKELLKHGANPNIDGIKNISPLHIAAFNGLKDMITELLKNGAEVNSRNTHNETPLHLAVSVNEDTRKLIGSVEDHVTIVTELIKNGADINAFDEKGQSPIHFAMEVPELAMVLLDHGANPNAEDLSKITPLHIAVSYKKVSIVEKLLKLGANVNVFDNENDCTPLHYAVEEFYSHTPESNFEEKHSEEEIMKILELLLENGANVNAISSQDGAPLHAAIHSSKLVSILLDYGADLNCKDDEYGITPIHQILIRNNPKQLEPKDEEILSIMLNKGKNIDFNLQYEGKTILEMALEKEYNQIARLIVGRICPKPKISDPIYPLKYLL